MSSLLKRGLGSLACMIATSVVLSSGCSAPPKGSLMLSISTDMQTPKDISTISIFVTEGSNVKFDYVGRVLPDGTVSLPSTLALVEPDSPNTQVQIRVIGFNEQTAQVLRDVQTTIPHERAALLRMPLDFLDLGSVTGQLPAKYYPTSTDGVADGDSQFDPTDPRVIVSTCDPMHLCQTPGADCQTMINGQCTSAAVASSTLPAYTPTEIFADGGIMGNGAPESCFDVQTCFMGATPVTSVTGQGTQTCSFSLPSGAIPSTLNVALVSQSTGACLASGCYVPLPNDPNAGWTVQGATVQLAPGVCAKLGNTTTLAMSSGPCSTETLSDPVCEPTTPAEVAEAGTPPILDAAPADAVTPDSGSAGDASAGLDATSTEAGIASEDGSSVDAEATDDATENDDSSMTPVDATTATEAGPVDATTATEAGPVDAATATDAGSTTADSSSIAEAATELTGVVAISVGYYSSCALLADGTVQCWGDNTYGELGNGNVTSSSTPVAVNGLTGATAISVGADFACALLQGGTVACWGDNTLGLLGAGSSTGPDGCCTETASDGGCGYAAPCSLTPVAVSSLTGATAVSAGGDSACALLPGGTVQCWGGNAYGALGNGAAGDYSATPVPVSGLSGAAAISVGSSSACAVLSGGTVECWGSNAVGELGDGTTIDSATPVVVSGLMNASSVSVGGSPANGQYSACAVISDGSVRCWGNTTFGALGNGTAIGPDTCCSAEEPDDAGCAFGFSVPCSPAPVAVSGLTGATAVSMASSFACALLSGGTVQCWGENDLGELGTGTYGPDSCCGVTIPDGGCLNALQACSWTPATVTGVVGATAISAQGNACALLSGGTVQCWGGNDNGQLGNGSTNGFSLTPVAVQ